MAKTNLGEKNKLVLVKKINKLTFAKKEESMLHPFIRLSGYYQKKGCSKGKPLHDNCQAIISSRTMR